MIVIIRVNFSHKDKIICHIGLYIKLCIHFLYVLRSEWLLVDLGSKLAGSLHIGGEHNVFCLVSKVSNGIGLLAGHKYLVRKELLKGYPELFRIHVVVGHHQFIQLVIRTFTICVIVPLGYHHSEVCRLAVLRHEFHIDRTGGDVRQLKFDSSSRTCSVLTYHKSGLHVGVGDSDETFTGLLSVISGN